MIATTLFSSTVNGGQHASFTGRRELEYVNGIRKGSKVTWKAFTDHRGEYHPPMHGLTVESITLHASQYSRHVRLACSQNGHMRCEANARFFVAE